MVRLSGKILSLLFYNGKNPFMDYGEAELIQSSPGPFQLSETNVTNYGTIN
jgi:hypothetical protein